MSSLSKKKTISVLRKEKKWWHDEYDVDNDDMMTGSFADDWPYGIFILPCQLRYKQVWCSGAGVDTSVQCEASMRTDSKRGDDGILGGGGRGVGAGLRWVTDTWAVQHYTLPSHLRMSTWYT